MKSFRDYIDQECLEEGLVRSGSIAAYAARARAEGNKAEKAYDRGKQALRAVTVSAGPEGRLERLEVALEALFDGLSHSRRQVGNSVALDMAGHTLLARVIKRLRDTSRR